MNPNVLAIVPARGGSKGVPYKNKRVVSGKPLVRYSIDAALSARRITHTLVTSDDADILDIARACGVFAIERPPEFAQDISPVIDAVRHAIQFMQVNQQLLFDAIVLLQPTTPLRTPLDIDSGVDLYFSQARTPVCSVYKCEDNHPARMYTIKDNRMVPLMAEWASTRRQDLPAIFHRNGALYVFGEDEVRSGSIISPSMTPYVMSQRDSINIDTELDLVMLEAFLGRQQ